jgi:type VI protein secretion system component Hcp
MCSKLQSWIPALALFFLAFATTFSPRAGAVIPMNINYQGHLMDDQGNPVPNGNYDFVFRFYDAETGGELLWTETHTDVPVTNGLFSVLLGSGVGDPLTVDVVAPGGGIADAFFVYMKIECEGELLEPATLLCSAPYAMITHRVNGDVTTSPGSLEIASLGGGGHYVVDLTGAGGEAEVRMESSDDFSVTKFIDKATPLLAMASMESGEGASLTKKVDQSSPMLFESTVESTDGPALTKMYDKATPQLATSLMESGEGLSTTKKTDQASPQLLESTVESTDGTTVTREIDKSTPLLYKALAVHKESETDSVLAQTTVDATGAEYSANWWGLSLLPGVGSDSGLVFMKGGPIGAIMGQRVHSGSDTLEALLSSVPMEEVGFNMGSSGINHKDWILLDVLPMEEVSLNMSQTGSDHAREIELVSGPMEQVSFNMSNGGSGHMEEVTLNAGPIEEVSLNMLQSGEGHSREIELLSGPMEQVSLNMSNSGSDHLEEVTLNAGPIEEVSFNMSHNSTSELEEIALDVNPIEEVSLRLTRGGEGVPTEEVSLTTGPGTEPVGMRMHKSSSLSPSENPADTNVQLLATTEGGYLAVSDVGGTAGDGFTVTVTDDESTLRLSDGGSNTGVYLEADSVTGGRLGINNDSPAEALQVGGNICASGTIGVCSDVRFKKNVETIAGALAAIEHLRGVRFKWKRDEFPQQRFTDDSQMGFVAQEIVEVVPEIVSQGSDGYYSVDYGKLTPLLVEAVKELKAQNEELLRRIETLEKSAR